jgi:hypothetical protein
MASRAPAIMREKPIPLKGASNQRERTRRVSFARISSFTGPPVSPSIRRTSGTAHCLAMLAHPGVSSGRSRSISAISSHIWVSGSSDCPVWIAWARNTPLSPPALAPATMSGRTRIRTPERAAISSSMSA